MTKLPLLAASLALLAAPAFAETAKLTPAEDNMLSVLSACAVGLGGAPALEAALTGAGWTKGETKDGETEFAAPKGAEDSFAYVAEDGTWCSAWSSAVTIAQARTMAQAVLEQVGVKQEDVSPFKDEYGCQGLKLATGETVSVVSSDEPPLCEGGTGAMVTFER